MIRVLSLGAGVQSSTLLLMSCLGELPKLDAAVFADTQWEPAAVYKWLEYLKTEAAGYGIPVYTTTRGNLREDGIHFRATGGKAAGHPGYKRWASIPFFVKNPDGSVGKINRQCTKEYKIEPVERCIRREVLGLAPRKRAKPGSVEHWFGISTDEPQRMRRSTKAWQVFRYPLIEDLESPNRQGLYATGYTRQDCLDWMERKGFPRPPRSACLGCPFRSDSEWRWLRETDQAGWEDACQFDEQMRAADQLASIEKFGHLRGLPFLHRSCVPLRQVILQDGPENPFVDGIAANECQGMCGN